MLTEKEVVMELSDEFQLHIGRIYVDWEDETEVTIRYFSWNKFEVSCERSLMSIVKVED